MNGGVAQATTAIITAFGALHDKGLIGDADLLDVCYRFAGELGDVAAVLERARVTVKGRG